MVLKRGSVCSLVLRMCHAGVGSRIVIQGYQQLVCGSMPALKSRLQVTHSLSWPIRSSFCSGNFALKLCSDLQETQFCESIFIFIFNSFFHRFSFATLLKRIFRLICLGTLLRWDPLSASKNTRFETPVTAFRDRFDTDSPLDSFCPPSWFRQE